MIMKLPQIGQIVKGYTLEEFLGYRKRTPFVGVYTSKGDIRSKFPDGRIIFVPFGEAQILKG